MAMAKVLIVESPGLKDISTGDREGLVLSELLQLIRVPVGYCAIETASLLQTRLSSRGRNAAVIHISTHGNPTGIFFTDGSSLTWKELQQTLLAHAWDKLVVLSACHSGMFTPDESQAQMLATLTAGVVKPPRCVLTMWGDVYFADAVLAWGLFYRAFFERLARRRVSSFDAHDVLESLKRVKAGGFSKICAYYWYGSSQGYRSISPWKDGKGEVKS
jgi:hypothetical protein